MSDRLVSHGCIAGLIAFLSVSLLNFQAHDVRAQDRGFGVETPTSQLSIGLLLEQWQAIQNDLRSTVGKDRRPEFEFRVLARTENQDSGKSKEVFDADKLPARLIVVIGGLQSAAHSAEQFAVALDESLHHPANSRMAVFRYPNDGSICESGSVLRDLLNELHTKSPATKVSIVAHSMGGLVARYALEPIPPQTKCEVPCVDQLVMICPPNHGSVLAQYADALELPDAITKLQMGSQSFTEVVGSLVNDGLGEACDELTPTSEFLRDLNQRPRAPGVRYHIIAGTGGPITPLIRLASSIAIRETQDRTRINTLPNANDLLKRADELLLSDEFAQGMGDGAVSVASTRLNGVSEFRTVPIQHGEWAQVDRAPVQQLIQCVTEVLNPKPARASF